MAVSQSARMFLRRAGMRYTPSCPRMLFAPAVNAVYTMRVERPLPLPELLCNGLDSPDNRGRTRVPWPHGKQECDQ